MALTSNSSANSAERYLIQETHIKAYSLPDLPYAYDALEPHIDARTMEIHHSKHHNAYITKVNDALEGSAFTDKDIHALIADLSALPEAIRGAVRNNGGGHYNHSLFWTSMSPQGGGTPNGDLLDAINRDFGGFDEFKTEFSAAADSRTAG